MARAQPTARVTAQRQLTMTANNYSPANDDSESTPSGGFNSTHDDGESTANGEGDSSATDDGESTASSEGDSKQPAKFSCEIVASRE
jgi:hypothetical protein